ncbi:MAG: zinc-binding dehydrogenase [Actinomycetota bacterium]|nr:alcohol dehydrogenase catalytic domain-containing protein [Actinomycetota bacterium]
MQQLTFISAGNLEWHESDDPTLGGPKQALVRPTAVAMCDLDIAAIQGLAPIPGPFALGHEFTATVIEVGDEVIRVRPGDEVICSFQISCGICVRCLRGDTGNCTEVNPGAMYGLGQVGGEHWGGAMADIVLVPFADAMLFAVSASISAPTLASSSDNIVDGYRTVAPSLAKHPGADVLIVAGGARSIPLYTVQIARALGAGRIDYIDHDVARLDLAEKFGARPIEGPPGKKAGSYQVTVDASATEDGLRCAIRSTEPGGTCTSIGIYYSDVEMPLLHMYSKGITFITGRPDSVATLPEVIKLIETGRIDPDELQTTFAWEDAIEALKDPPVKTIFVRD